MDSGLTDTFKKKKSQQEVAVRLLHGLGRVLGLHGSENCTWPVGNALSLVILYTTPLVMLCCHEKGCAVLCSFSHTAEICFDILKVFNLILLSTCWLTVLHFRI